VRQSSLRNYEGRFAPPQNRRFKPGRRKYHEDHSLTIESHSTVLTSQFQNREGVEGSTYIHHSKISCCNCPAEEGESRLNEVRSLLQRTLIDSPPGYSRVVRLRSTDEPRAIFYERRLFPRNRTRKRYRLV
jgi:hypothetical protein